MNRRVLRIAREELRLMARDRTVAIGVVCMLLLAIIAGWTSFEHRQAVDGARTRHQAEVDAAFAAQPDRHPHRVVHYGHFVFRPLEPLAAIDPGVDAYTGHVLYLEGHRQNSANFADARQSSALLRFGQPTPAFALQLIAPLLVVFIGYRSLAGEREAGRLRLLLAQGVRGIELIAGKWLALAVVAVGLLAPMVLAVGAMAVATAGTGARLAPAGAALVAAYAAWLLGWCFAIVAVSARCRHARQALAWLLVGWSATVVLLPRLAGDLADAAAPLATRVATDIRVAADLASIGDPHDPSDPYFDRFRRAVLARYGVERVEDLPVNYKGLVGIEGERLSSELFDRQARASFDAQARQGRWMDAVAVVAPLLALRRVSMTLAGSDRTAHERFLTQAERHRYALVQGLNGLQAEAIAWADDQDSARRVRLPSSHWRDAPAFVFEAEPVGDRLRRSLAPAAVLGGWCLGLLVLAAGIGWRLDGGAA